MSQQQIILVTKYHVIERLYVTFGMQQLNILYFNTIVTTKVIHTCRISANCYYMNYFPGEVNVKVYIDG